MRRSFLLSLTLIFHAVVSAQEPVGVGVILPLTGDAGGIGQAIKNGIELAYSELDDAEKASITLHFEDDRLVPRESISSFRKLTDVDGVDVVINASSGTGNALAPLAEQEEIPLIAIASDKKIVEGRNWVVNFWVTPEKEAVTALKEAKNRGYERIAAITTIQDGMLAARDAFLKEGEEALDVVINEEYPAEIKDFKPFIAKLRSALKIDAVMVLLLPGQLGVFAKQYRQAGFDSPLFGIESFEDPNEVKIAEGALNGQWFVSSSKPNDQFAAEFKRRFPESSTWGAANGHDAVLLIVEAVKKHPSRKEINRFLHRVNDFEGALGRFSATPDNRYSLGADVYLIPERESEQASG